MTIKQKEVVSQGIVLKSMPYKENDALITVYFHEYGKMTMIARGVKKLKSKNAAAVMTLTCAEFTFIPRSGLSLMLKATALDYYRHIKEDIVLEAYATYFAEFVLKNEEDNHPDEQIYHYLQRSLEALNEGYVYQLVYLLFNAFILKQCGAPLQVDGCSRCGKKNQIIAVSLEDGGFICQSCFMVHDKRLDKKVLAAFRHINKYTIDDIDHINIDEKMFNELIEIMDHYVDELTGLIFGSRKFIRQLEKL